MDRALEIFVERVVKRCQGDETALRRESLGDLFELALYETKEQLEKERKEHARQMSQGGYG